MRVSELSVYKDLLYAVLIVFSAASLSSLEFMKNAFPSVVIVHVPKTTVIYMIVLVQVLPALVLVCADRLIAARDSSGRRLRVFRSVLFVVAVILIVRQLQLYWDPATDLTDSVSSSGLVLLVLVDLTFLAAIVGLAIWLFRGLALFFAYMSPVAIAMTILVPFQVPTSGSCELPSADSDCLPDTYGQEAVTATQSESQPSVFVLVFDELGYDVLLDDGGELDAQSFPNLAALADDGVWFTNATTNYNWSLAVLPAIIDPVKSLAEHFNIRLYTQFRQLEQHYNDDCGIVMTCRGAGYLTYNHQLRMAGQLALRSFYQATPKPVETAINRPMGWLLDRLGWSYPPLDYTGVHTFTKRQFSVFLGDIKGRTALGRIHVLHPLLPHPPFAFNGEGAAVTTSLQPQAYRQQSMYVDVLIGKFTSKLKREGIYDDSVIVFMGDHGQKIFIPTAESPPTESIPHVPLLIHAPGLNSAVSDVDYQTQDFGPTLTDILGLPPPDVILHGHVYSPGLNEGVSAFSTERPQRDKVFYVNALKFVYSDEDDSWHFSQEE